MSFKDKVAIVTGASAGIGAAIAVAFAKEGADVVLVGRNETRLAAVEQICISHGKPPLVIQADVSKDDDAKRLIQITIDKFGKLDVLINNAGLMVLGNISDGKLMQAFDEVVDTNLRAPMQLTCLAAPHLIQTKGNIINVSGVGSQRAPKISKAAPHCITKAGLDLFTLISARELSIHGIRVNAVSPGPVYTEMLVDLNAVETSNDYKAFTALNRVSQPEEIADLVLYLVSDKAKCITGSIYVCDNGWLLK